MHAQGWTGSRMLLAVLVTMALCLSGCATDSRRDTAGQVKHIEFYWLKNPTQRNQLKMILAALTFRDIAGVANVESGTVLTSNRIKSDSSYDVAIIVTLRDATALQYFFEDRRYKSAEIDVFRPLVKRTVMYDITDAGSVLKEAE